MKKRLLCLLLCLALLLTGCANVNFGGYFSALGQMMGLNTNAVTKFSDMTYTHPDMDALQETLDAACDTAANGKDLQAVLRGILDYYDAYDRFYTNYHLADIYYCADLRDSYWADEYAYCGSNVSTADAGLETLYRALAQSPYRSELEGDDYFGADYFTAYDGEAFYDETLLDLFQQESDLISDYYVQNDKAAQADTEEAYYTTYVPAMEETLLSLIALRQKIAVYCGYDSYAQFAYDQSYYRDFTPEEAQNYLAAIQSQLGPIYAQVRDLDTGLDAPGKEADTVAYVASAAKAMGVSERTIAFKHILPNVVSVILVTLTLDFAGCMLTESSLSYLGFGVHYPRPTWGNMLNGANNATIIGNYWWQWLFTSLFLAVTTICINIVGDTLRDVMDPKSNIDK